MFWIGSQRVQVDDGDPVAHAGGEIGVNRGGDHHPILVRGHAVRIHEVRCTGGHLALAGLDDLDHGVTLRVEHADRAPVSLIHAGATHERDEHVLLAVDAVPDDIFANLLALGVQAGDTLDNRGPLGVTRQADLGQAALGIETRRVQPSGGTVVQVVQGQLQVRQLEVLHHRTEVRRFRIQLHDGDAVPGAERGQTAQQHHALALLDVRPARLGSGALRLVGTGGKTQHQGREHGEGRNVHGPGQ